MNLCYNFQIARGVSAVNGIHQSSALISPITFLILSSGNVGRADITFRNSADCAESNEVPRVFPAYTLWQLRNE